MMQVTNLIAPLDGQVPYFPSAHFSAGASFIFPTVDVPTSSPTPRTQLIKAKIKAAPKQGQAKQIGQAPTQSINSSPLISTQEREADFKQGIAVFQQSCPDFFKPLNLV